MTITKTTTTMMMMTPAQMIEQVKSQDNSDCFFVLFHFDFKRGVAPVQHMMMMIMLIKIVSMMTILMMMINNNNKNNSKRTTKTTTNHNFYNDAANDVIMKSQIRVQQLKIT